jgi:hypothetical protein
MTKTIEIFGASVGVKKGSNWSFRGNSHVGRAKLVLSMRGGVAALHLALEDGEGHADFRLEKAEVVELIRGLATLYELEMTGT